MCSQSEVMKDDIIRTVILLILLTTLTGCDREEEGIFGALPRIYAEMTQVENKMNRHTSNDATTPEKLKDILTELRDLEAEAQTECLRIKGSKVNCSASLTCGYTIADGEIANAEGGSISTVSIRIAAQRDSASNDQVYCFFLSHDNKIVSKEHGFYSSEANAIYINIEFNAMPSGKLCSPEFFDRYKSVSHIIIVSVDEFTSGIIPQHTRRAANITIRQDALDDLITPGNLHQPKPIEKDTVAQPEEEVQLYDGPVLTNDGVGEVRIGAAINDLPEHLQGIYDSRKVEMESDEMEEEMLITATFYRNGKVVMTALGDTQGNIVYLSVDGSGIKTEIDGKYFGVGDALRSLMKQKGVKRDTTGAFAAHYGDISFSSTPRGKIHSMAIGAVW